MVYIKYFIRISRDPDRTDFAEETYKTNSIFEAISTFRSHHSDKKKYVIYDFGYVHSCRTASPIIVVVVGHNQDAKNSNSADRAEEIQELKNNTNPLSQKQHHQHSILKTYFQQ